MNRLAKIAATALLPPLAARASGNGTGTIAGYLSYSVGSTEYFFFTTSSLSGTPSCDVTNRFVVPSSDPKFRTTVAMVLEAYAESTPVIAVGAGTCNAFPNSEDLINVVIGKIAY